MLYIAVALHHYGLDPIKKGIIPWNPWQKLYILLILKRKAGNVSFGNYHYLIEQLLPELPH